MKTVQIDHPHAEVIAAFFSGKTVQVRADSTCEWEDRNPAYDGRLSPLFVTTLEWRIKPEPLEAWFAMPNQSGDVFDLRGPFDSREAAERVYGPCRIVRMVEQPE